MQIMHGKPAAAESFTDLMFWGAKAGAVPLRTSFHLGSPDFSLNMFISRSLKPPDWSGFSMAPSRSAANTCACRRGSAPAKPCWKELLRV